MSYSTVDDVNCPPSGYLQGYTVVLFYVVKTHNDRVEKDYFMIDYKKCINIQYILY